MPVNQERSIWERYFNRQSPSGTVLSAVFFYPSFHHYYSLLKQSQWWTREKLQEYQDEQLKKLIIHAYAHVPFYRRSFDKIGLQISDICSIHDLQRLPFLTKEEVRNNLDDLRAHNYSRYRFESMATGGSTGYPLPLYNEKGKTAARYLAFYRMMLERTQCRLMDRYLFIIQSKQFWKNQAFGRILVMSPYSLRDKNSQILFDKIKKINPHYIIGFPSAISLLGHLLIKKKDNLFTNLRAILCSGETLYEWQRSFLEKVFCCKVFSFYAQAEQVIFAATCECSNFYHVFPEYGAMELIDEDGKIITHEGKQGEIVGTGFTNDIFPLIRYRTGDMGVYTSHLCPCGRHYPLLMKIEGRTQEFIINKMGDKLPMTGMYGIIPNSSNFVKEYQFFQREPGELILKIVRYNGFSDKDEHLIVQRLLKTLGAEFQIVVEYVNTVKRTPAGKIQFLVKGD